MEKLKQKVASRLASLQQAAARTDTDTEPNPAAAGLMATQASAHLTEEEREILLQVFKKEEQFKRDTINGALSFVFNLCAPESGNSKENAPNTNFATTGATLHKHNAKQMSASRAAQQTTDQSSGADLITKTVPPKYRSETPRRPQSGQQSQSSIQQALSSSSSNANQHQQSISTPSSSSAASNSFVSARSNTPLSRPGSSAFGTPCSGTVPGSSQQRTPSSCSTATSASMLDPLGKCRICRKSMSSSEICHLCSNCNQFICDDCASYSATDQHWMCSSCRRRATKPAIPTEALRELGLNQNSSAVRRMTLRLNQNDLKLALKKGSNDSTGSSSNSSSGCSSVSVLANQANLRREAADKSGLVLGGQQQRGASRGPKQQQQQQQSTGQQAQVTTRRQVQDIAGLEGSSKQAASSKAPASCSTSSAAQLLQEHQPDKQQCDIGGPSQTEQFEKSRRKSTCYEQQQQQQAPIKTLSQPAGSRSTQQSSQSSSSALEDHPQLKRAPSGGAIPLATRSNLMKHQEQRVVNQSSRRASVAVAAQAEFVNQRQQRNPNNMPLVRKQSTAFFTQTNKVLPDYSQLNYFFLPQSQHQARSFAASQQHHFVQPATVVTAAGIEGAGSAQNIVDEMSQQQQQRRGSMAQQYAQQMDGATLIPIPPDQIHLRRLSDQSNLFRRSSIIADTIDSFALARNRSHSNIDAVNYYSNYFHQSPLAHLGDGAATQSYGCSDDNLHNSNQLNVGAYSSQQRRPSDQWAQQQHVAAQQQQLKQEQAQAALYAGQQRREMSSIVTSYSQLQHRSSEDLRSDSSSDIDDQRMFVNNYEFDNERPSEYFAPPRAFSNADYLSGATELGSQTNPMSIPSVSVSEFSNSNHQHHNLNRQHYDAMQINVAIEQAIMQQQQKNNSELLAANQQMPRRGSAGRVLPMIPGEQSRSLLDLPHSNAIRANNQPDNGAAADQAFSMLDLPALSPTIRRASAPEGQNIKIVVDDIDASLRVGNVGKTNMSLYGKQGEFYERLTLYREESIDPNTNMARGFGLQVMGGKIDTSERNAAGETQLQACVTWILAGGPADKVGLRVGDKIIEWDGKCLVNMTYEQVAEVIESSANIAELLVKPAQRLNAEPANYVRSQRRMSQQTERDLKRIQQQQPLCANGNQHFLPEATRQNQASGEQAHYHRMHNTEPVQPALSAGNLPAAQYKRTGTGRRLPQIPGALLSSSSPNNNNVLLTTLSDSKNASSSTGQLEHKSEGSSNILLGQLQDNQQSRSVGEFYNNTSYHQQVNLQNGYNCLQQPTSGIMGASYNSLLGTNASYNNDNYFAGQNGEYLNVAGNQDEVCGSIGLQVNVDERVAQLEICVLSAINMIRNPNLKYYVRVRILPESKRFKPCTTLPRSDMNWNETLLFQNFPIQSIQRMALEIEIWVHDEAPRLSTQIAQPICETLIPIQSARERNTDFWPMRRPPTSPQARRKSLNDLIDLSMSGRLQDGQLSAGYLGTAQPSQWPLTTNAGKYSQQQLTVNGGSQQQLQQKQAMYEAQGEYFVRERSASNRNLPDSSKLRVQPRRASDEVATSTSHRLSTRVSPAQSRRSISVVNVGDGFSRPSSRRGSQINMIKNAHLRDSNQQLQQASGGSPISKYSTPQSVPLARNEQSQASGVGVTPSGRRSSLVGIQSMAGYRSQKNSHSDTAADQDSPLHSRRSQPGTPRQSNLLSNSSPTSKPHHRDSVAGTSLLQSSNPTPIGGSGASSRRGSSSAGHSSPLQRKGSFALMTLRKLKRTMSLTKGNDSDQGGNRDSRKSSSSSTQSTELGEDEGVIGRIIANKDFVGKLKLSFIMTKGQLEIDVISAQGLKYDQDSALGVYVKMYLKGKNRSNKRKTRLIQPWQSPVFKQVIKYDGSLVDNKSLEVSVWQKQGGLKGKLPIGLTEVRLNELNLSQLQVGWYNLRSMDALGGSSMDE